MSYHTGGMRSNMTRTSNRTTTRARRRVMRGNNRMMNGSGARGVRRTAGQFGGGGIRRTNVTRPAPVMTRGRTSRIMTNGAARNRFTTGTGIVGFRGVDQFGNNN